MADPFKLEQVVTNIVENAYKYGLSHGRAGQRDRPARAPG